MLNEKVIIIAGGMGLLGKKMVDATIASGAKVVVADVNIPKIDATNTPHDKNKSYVTLDINSQKSWDEAIQKVVNQYGKIDALVNCAYPRNKSYGTPFESVTYDSFCENVSLHLGGYFNSIQRMTLFFKQQGFGNIVVFSSIYGVIPPRFEIYEGTAMTMPVEYAAIKSALIHLVKYTAKYVKGKNIRINAISPGGVADDSQAESFKERYNHYGLTKGLLETQDISGTLLYLLSDMSGYVNGQNIVVDGGWSL